MWLGAPTPHWPVPHYTAAAVTSARPLLRNGGRRKAADGAVRSTSAEQQSGNCFCTPREQRVSSRTPVKIHLDLLKCNLVRFSSADCGHKQLYKHQLRKEALPRAESPLLGHPDLRQELAQVQANRPDHQPLQAETSCAWTPALVSKRACSTSRQG